MAEIDVETIREDGEGFAFDIRVSEGGDRTHHHVTMSRQDYEVLGTGSESPEDFIRQAFVFLLEREPKESIMSRFDVGDISTFYPRFREEVLRRRSTR